MVARTSSVRMVRLAANKRFEASLAFYPSHYSQDRHKHNDSSLAVVIAGALEEDVEGTCHRAGPGQMSVKPREVAHADRFGRQGAVLLSLRFHCEETAAEVIGTDGWQWRLVPRALASLTCDMRNAGSGSDLDDLMWDVVGASRCCSTSHKPPEWLRWAREELDRRDCRIDIAQLAGQAGVHRAQLSRQFVRHFGLAPSAYRLHQMAGRALRDMVDFGVRPAAAAYDAGFADQSHMTRTIRRVFGLTPAALASMLRY